MIRSLLGRVVVVLPFVLGLQASSASAGIPERLKWVRGTVASAASDIVSIRLRGKELPVAIDEATEVMLVTAAGLTRAIAAMPASGYLNVGDAIEVHYRDGRPTGTARYIWVGISLDRKSISKRPGTSAAGSIAALKAGNWLVPPRVTLMSGKDHRSFRVTSSAQIMDERGIVALARTQVLTAADALEPNAHLVIVYHQHKSTLDAQLLRMVPARQ